MHQLFCNPEFIDLEHAVMHEEAFLNAHSNVS
jgi:hypothetical protein